MGVGGRGGGGVRFARRYTPRLHLNVVAELAGKFPGVLHTGEGYRSFSGTLRTGEANRKKQLPGLDPRTAHWLATLLRRSSMAKEKTITSNKEVWSCRLLVSRVPLAGSRSRSDLE